LAPPRGSSTFSTGHRGTTSFDLRPVVDGLVVARHEAGAQNTDIVRMKITDAGRGGAALKE
jgi:glucose/arabinose dehydrogenase